MKGGLRGHVSSGLALRLAHQADQNLTLNQNIS
jgi:hypothetical protein